MWLLSPFACPYISYWFPFYIALEQRKYVSRPGFLSLFLPMKVFLRGFPRRRFICYFPAATIAVGAALS